MSAIPARHLMSIGDALNLLKDEFPDLTISKLRFLETEGLVEPQRTSSGYRKYSHADVQRVRYILQQQRDHYLPLRVIKQQLEALDRGLEMNDAGSPKPPRALVGIDLPDAEGLRPLAKLKLTASELLEAAGAEPQQLAECQSFGLIDQQASHFGADDVAILKNVALLAAFGIEARHLRPFKMAADREVGLVEQVVAPLRKQSEGGQKAEDVSREVAALTAALHIALVRSLLN